MERTVTIKPHQIAHFRRMREILSSWFVAIDNSECGGGKTVVTTAVALSLGLSLVVIAPPGVVHSQWKETAKRYGVPLIMVISYERLRLPSTPQALETSLVRRLDTDELADRGNNAQCMFEHTSFFAKLLSHGILLVFDEFHRLKTDGTQQMNAAHCLIRALVHNPTTISRACLLSATPCDRFENAVSLLRMLGIMTHQTLLPDGIVEVAEIANELDPLTLSAITAEYGGKIGSFTRMKQKRADRFAYEVYRDIFGPCLRSSTIKPPSTPGIPKTPMDFETGYPSITHLRLNGFFKFPEEDNALLKNAYETFSSSLSDNQEKESCIRARTQSLIEMEIAKVNTIARLVKARLNDEVKHPHAKVIVYMNYKASIKDLAQALASYTPMVLNGDTSDKERTSGVAVFQRPTDECRLIIAHPSVGGVGVNLDDTDGRFPRTQYACPSFMFISMHQLMGRVARTSSLSSSESYIVFSDAVPEELRMIDNLSRKARTMKDYKSGGQVDDIVYPGEYESYKEN